MMIMVVVAFQVTVHSNYIHVNFMFRYPRVRSLLMHSGRGWGGDLAMCVFVYTCVCVRACVCVCMGMCVHVSVRACLYECTCLSVYVCITFSFT